MAGLGDLVVRLSAETAQFTEALNKASYTTQKNMGMISNSVKTAGLAIGSYLSADALVAFVRSSIDAQDEIFKMSQKIGIATDELSKLQYAAKLSDVSSQQLQVGLVKLSRGLADAADDSGEARNALNAMGISIKNADGSLKSADQVLGDVADKFSTYRDGVTKTAIATQLFGKSGADLIPLLNQGRDGLKEAGDELFRFGGVVMPEAAKQAEIFNDNMTKLGTVASSAGKSIVNELLSPINRVIGLLFAINKVAAERQMSFWEFLKPPTKETASAFLEIEKLWEKYKGTAEDTSKAVTNAPVIPDLKKIEAGTSALNKLVEASLNNLEAQTRQGQLGMATVGMSDAQRKATEDLVKIYELQIEKESQINELLTAKKITQAQATEAVKQLNTASNEARTQVEELYKRQEELNSSYEYGATVSLRKYIEESKNLAKLSEGVVTNAMKGLDDALFGIITRTTSVADAFKSMTASILSDIAKILIRQSITAPIANALAGAIGGAFTSNVNLGSQSLGSTSTGSTGFGINPNASLSGMRAMGGSVGAGNSYLVGEMGAEVFTPNTNGYITPNNQLGGSTNVVVNVNMAEGTTSASDGNQLGIMIGNVVKAELVKQKRAGGLLA
jgi:lambda family phage tail tape measure protein